MKITLGYGILALFSLLFTSGGQAQGVTYYPWSSVLAVSSNPQRLFWGEARFQTNSLFSSLDTELAPMVNFRRSPQSQFYAGAGANFAIVANLADGSRLVRGYFLSVGTRVHPLDQVPQVGVAFEISPYTAQDFKSGRFRTWLGVTWQFGRRNKSSE
ncbi:MAG: hypothetical protein H7Y12_11490 [Sphingobacteriaceae bacterium]|nr:hypothetical protein [Cytophagaceae bacterium]